MAHLLQARQSGAVAEAKIVLSKEQYHFVVDLYKWDEASSSAVRLGERKFSLPANLYHAFSVTHLKERLGTLLPPVTPGGEHQGAAFDDAATLTSLGVNPAEDVEAQAFLVFNLDKSAHAAPAHAAGGDAHGLSRTTSVAVKAGTGPISPDRELAVVLSIYQDSGSNHVTVTATNASAGINFESKVQVPESYWTSMTVKELKRKLGSGFPPTSDRGVLGGSKNIKDTDKWGALGVKGKKGETVKYNAIFELGGSGAAVSSATSPRDTSSSSVSGEPAPEIDPKQQFKVELSISLLEGNVFLKFVCTSEVLPELVKSAALPKMSYQVFNVRDLHNLLKGTQWPILQSGWAVFENPDGSKIKVTDLTSLSKLGVTFTPGKTSVFRFVFAIDPHAALPTPQ